MILFGQILRTLREDKDLKQSDLASLLNISSSAYGFYEQGKREPSLDSLIKLSEFFDVSIDYLLGLTSENKPNNVSAISNAPSLSQQLNDEDIEVLEYYHKLDKIDKQWIIGQMIDLDRKSHQKENDIRDPKQA